MSQAKYRVTYQKPSVTGIKGQFTGSLYFTNNASVWDGGHTTFTSQGYTVTVTDLESQQSKEFKPE